MRIKTFSVFLLLLSLSCEPQLVDDPIPFVPFDDLEANLNLPEYFGLRTTGGHVAINSIGVRGVIAYRLSATEIIAYERNCSYQPASSCATVGVHSSGLFLEDACCNSNFNFSDGLPSGGPAWRPLRQYFTELNGSILTITDEIEF
ncbi:MAG: hypothetical protein HC811_07675 [Flammeovirgaceae bacterium]|nr:hypothetical protein [Flammeovirgaceae bacterium]